MTAASLLKQPPQNGLQPVNLPRHLGGIADLMELCFGAEMDASGRGMIREMQFLSRAGPLLHLINAAPLGQPPWNLGYVWLEGGRVVGSVSTQRTAPRSRAWLVANVAVHPDHRRRGIAWAMMGATLDHIQSQGGTQALLQVDDDNLGAVELYRRLGFARVTTQTAWTRPARLPPPAHEPVAVEVRLRTSHEWRDQFDLAALVRPEGVAWSRPLSPGVFRPSVWRRLEHFFSGQTEEHWVIRLQDQLAGSLTVRINGPDGDRLILLVHPQFTGQVERPLLIRGLRRLGMRSWTTRIEHSADDEHTSETLRSLGFQAQRTLRWMKRDLR
jgi:ribosomal protein S18 acetylase RimI-like enzyme